MEDPGSPGRTISSKGMISNGVTLFSIFMIPWGFLEVDLVPIDINFKSW